MKENKGITLIALIITIIIMLLLVGITVYIVGGNGIIKNTENALDQSKIEAIREEIELAISKKMAIEDNDITIDQIIEQLEKQGTISPGNSSNGQVTIQPEGYIYKIKKDENGKWEVKYQKPVDWEQAKNNATKPAGQTNTNNIGLDQYGNIVNMDNWNVRWKSNYCELKDTYIDDDYYYDSGYLGEFDSEGRIEGKVPQWIKNSEDNKWYEVRYFCLGDETELKIAPEIPPSVTSLSSTFYGCSSLVKAPEIPPSVTDMTYTFSRCSSLIKAPEIPSGVTEMMNTFSGCSSLIKAPELPPNLTNMYATFYGCSSLTKAPQIPSSVTEMRYTFYECSSLIKAPEIPSGVTDMTYTFYVCSSLIKAPEIPSGVTDMTYTFYQCSSLVTAPEIPSSVTDMTYTFRGCSSLVTAPEIPFGVTNMTSTFELCSSLTTAPEIPSSVTNMQYTFYRCRNLTTAPEIPASVTNMNSTFRYSSSLTGQIKILATSLNNYYSTFDSASKNTGTNLVVKVKTQDILNKLKGTLSGNEHITFELIT